MKKHSEYEEQIKTIEACVLNQDYIIDSSRLFYNWMHEERNIFKKEGACYKSYSNTLIESVTKDGVAECDFSACSVMFGKYFQIIGQLISQANSLTQNETKYDEIEALIEDIKEHNKVYSKQIITEKLKELDKLKSLYWKKKRTYKNVIASTEEAITRSSNARADPKMAYDLGTREALEEEANKLMVELENKKHSLKKCINDLNSQKETWIDLINKKKDKTKWAISQYVNLLVNTLTIDIKLLDDHYEGVDLLSSEKIKHFENAQKLKYFQSKNLPTSKLRDLRLSLSSGEITAFRKLKVYKDSVLHIIEKEKFEFRNSNKVLEQLRLYLEQFTDIKETSNKK